jgi:sRNA-binding protein
MQARRQARIDLTADIAGTVTEREANFARQMLAQRRRKKLAAAANITSGRLGAGGSVGPNKTEGHGAPSRASVAKGVRLRHEKYFTS